MCDDQNTPTLDCEKRFGPGVTYGPYDPTNPAASNNFTNPGRARGENEQRDSSCDDPRFAVEVTKCRKTCATCCAMPQYSCENPPPTAGFSCALTEKPKCLTPPINAIMSLVCPATCGTCEQLNIQDPNCRDTINLVMCAQYKANNMCNPTDPTTLATRRRECARTCGFCTPMAGGMATTVRPPTIPGGVTPGPGILGPTRGPLQFRDLADNCYRNRKLCDSKVVL